MHHDAQQRSRCAEVADFLSDRAPSNDTAIVTLRRGIESDAMPVPPRFRHSLFDAGRVAAPTRKPRTLSPHLDAVRDAPVKSS